jgi:hypothetical protein
VGWPIQYASGWKSNGDCDSREDYSYNIIFSTAMPSMPEIHALTEWRGNKTISDWDEYKRRRIAGRNILRACALARKMLKKKGA